MMNDKYILSRLGESHNNAFMVDFSMKLKLHGLCIDGSAKIDTGCESTSISLQSRSVGIDEISSMAYKKEAVKSHARCRLSFGLMT